MENYHRQTHFDSQNSILEQRQKEIERIVSEHNFQEINSDFPNRKPNKKYFQDVRSRYIWEVDLTKLETYPEFFRPNLNDYQELMKLNQINLKMTSINQQSQIFWEIY